MSQTNRKYKRLEGLLSGARPANPDPARRPENDDVDALKERIAELEAQLTGQSGTAEKKVSIIVQETVSQSLPSKPAKESRANTAKQPAMNKQPRLPEDPASKSRNAFLIAMVIAVAHFAAVAYYLYLGRTTGIAQFYALAAISFGLGVLIGTGAVLSRRGQPTLGIILVLGVLAVSYPPIATLVSGLGLVLGPALIVAGPMSVFQVLPRRSGWVMTVATIASGLATLLLDVFGSAVRPPLPGIFIPLLAASVIGALGFFIVRQFRDYSLRTKLPLTVIFLMMLAFLVATSLSVRAARDSLTKTLGNDLVTQASSQAELIRSYLTWTRSMAIDLAAAAEAIPFDEATMLPTIRQTLQRNEQIFGSTIAYEPYQFQPDLYYWSPYYSRASDGTIQFTQLGNATYNYFQWDWYTLPKKANAPVLSPPYFDEGGGNIWMVTWSVPFYDSAGKFKGVATTDMSFQQTQEIVRQIEVGTQGYAFLINQDGTVLGIGDQGGQYQVMEESMLVTDSQQAEEWNNLLAAMIEGKSGFGEVADPQGKRMFVAYEPVGLDTGWYLGLAFPQTELFEPAEQLQATLILLSILVAMVASVVLFFFTRSITLPIQQLASRAKLFSQGQIDLSQVRENKPISIQTHDELEELGNAFDQMISELAIAFQNLEDRVADRTHDLELASEVGRTITEKVGNVYDMLTEATELIRSRFSLYYTQVYLLDPSGRNLTLRAGTGDVGKELLQRGHRLPVGSGSLNGRAVSEKKSIIVADTTKGGTFLPNPLLPKTRSEMAVPLIVSGRVLGVLDMQSEIPDALNEFNLPAFETLAGQLSIAIQNAVLFAQSEEARKDLEANIRQTAETGWEDFLNGIERGEKIGYRFNQTEVTPIENVNETQNANTLNAPINVTGATVGAIQVLEEERDWTSHEAEIVQATADRLATHIESLRLLAQAESYRSEAEQAARRLTREGWENYVQTLGEPELGYTFNLTEVQPLAEKSNGDFNAVKHPLVVRDETIGELVTENVVTSAETAEIVSAVSRQLSSHIETLRLSEELRKRAKELEELDRLKSAFLANMSHELRTPLNSVLGFADVILEGLDGPLTENMHNDLRLIQNNGKHLLHLINDVLDMAKIESGKMNLDLEKFKVHDVLDEVISITSTLASEKNLSLLIEDRSDRNVEIFADHTRLRQVMINLVNNSIKFAETGEITLSVSPLEGARVLISVKDTGIGIPPDKLEAVFQEFAQMDTSSTRKVGGTGLGLPISRRLVKLHGGRLWAESSGIPGEGSTFFVELPLEARLTEVVEKQEK